MCGGGVRSILLLPLVARCLHTIYVSIRCIFVFMSVVVTVWGMWKCISSLIHDFFLLGHFAGPSVDV